MDKFENLLKINGKKIVTTPHPHEVWPPKAGVKELKEIAEQRNKDIGIKGKSGPIKEFEELFSGFLNSETKYQITFNSGTSALFAAYFSLGLKEGDEVIGPALTYHAALSPIFTLKANVVLVDVDINTRCIDPDLIEKSITKKTKAITVVHQWGHPANMDKIMAIAKKHNLKVVEDCSHAHGSKYKGKLCGTFGDVAVFSLQTNKAIFAGEGGILVTNDENIHSRATLFGHYRDRSREEISDSEYQKYWVTGFGLKLRMSPFNAIVAKYSLKNFPKVIKERHKCLNYLNDRLSEVPFLQKVPIASYAYMGAWYGLKPVYKKEVLDNFSLEKLITILQKEGLEVSIPSGPTLSTQPLYNEIKGSMFPDLRKKGNKPESTPVAIFLQNNSISFPIFSDFKRDKKIIDQYISVLKRIYELKEYLKQNAAHQ